MSNIFLYRGKDEARPADESATLHPVRRLTEPTEYHNKDYIVSLDNWYGSLEAVSCLISEPRNMDCVRTIKTNRKGIPKDAIFKVSVNNIRGEAACQLSNIGTRTIYFISWQDSKPVHLVSSIRPNIKKFIAILKMPTAVTNSLRLIDQPLLVYTVMKWVVPTNMTSITLIMMIVVNS